MVPASGARRQLLAAAAPMPLTAPRAAFHAEIAALVSRLRTALLGDESAPCESLAVRARLTPLDAQGRPRDARDVRLRELNEWGVAFEHPAPLADRRALVSVESPRFGAIAAEVELSWCRYNEGGRYTSGGRFVQMAPPSSPGA
ncbi:MAG TPA: hypothetical protein VEQ85_12580 [Lacipirellulaceae bacterium]|nr:hypothetical protein [Lacipirellulaceae bacterium]